jgi:peptidoglycan/xylan/chitin deacetylase (PgdA/CDA1 family)
MKKRKSTFIIWYIIAVFMVSVFTILGMKIYKTEDEIAEMQEKEIAVSFDEIEESKRKELNYLSLSEDPYADDARIVQNALLKWNFQSAEGRKVAYLTFDDGPSTKVTPQVLDVLKEHNVKGTFFVLGSMLEKSEDSKVTLIRIAEEGHAIGNHGYCHKYDVLYPNSHVNVDAFMNDMDKSLETMRSVLGEDFNTRVIRFPGGHNSWRTSDIDKVLTEKNYAFIDWNIVNGDAHAAVLSKDQMMSNLKKYVQKMDKNNDTIVVLMHDTDKNINEADFLNEAIIYLKGLGYEFRTLK